MTHPEPAPRDELLVADSFRVRVREGRAEVRGLSHHIDRFVRSTHSASGGGPRGLGNFLDEARFRIAEYGEGFPRWELRRSGADRGLQLRLSLRPLPELRTAIELRSAPGVVLEHPDRKGPNISRLAELNRNLGAEALLLDPHRRAVEGATTSLIWWEDGVLFASEVSARVPSVTERLIDEAATAFGIPRASASLEPEALAAHEVWAVNALHGIRPVSAIDGIVPPAPDPHRLARFREAIDATWQEVAPARLRIK